MRPLVRRVCVGTHINQALAIPKVVSPEIYQRRSYIGVEKEIQIGIFRMISANAKLLDCQIVHTTGNKTVHSPTSLN